MHFQLRIDPEKPERVVVCAHRRSELVEQIEALVTKGTEENQLTGYTEDDMRLLSFSEIQCILVEDGCTMAEMSPERKNEISHRARALQALAKKLKEAGSDDDK